ncbi:MAG: 7-cyano-7-deazaguanine synthase QueC [Nitrospirae bacterium]|nr:7-cyano-7-deazaguanine synthase QueC [Nitrospirota bacterium]
MKKAVVLLSGGVDSTVTGAIAKSCGFDIYAMSFDYGQRHKIELISARLSAKSLNAMKHLIIKFDLRKIGGSALTSDIEVPKERMKDELGRMNKRTGTSTFNLQPSTLIPVTYVPARNTIFLSFALAWAEALDAENIFIGANAVDYSGYPDCRPEFIKSFETMANLATKASVEGNRHIKINTPLINLTKAAIIKKGIELGVDFSLTWSCYDPQPARAQKSEVRSQKSDKKIFNLQSSIFNLIPCGRCDSCLLRAKGFRDAGIKDPLIV